MTKLECKRALGRPLHTHEIDFRRKLESLKQKLNKPNQFQAKVAELQSIVHMQDERGTTDSLNYKLDQDSTMKFFEALDFQRRGIATITKGLTKALQDITVVQEQLDKEKPLGTIK